MDFLIQPAGPARLGDWLNANLRGEWTVFRAAVAFAKHSGVRHIASALSAFAQAKHVEIIVGADHQGTSYEGLKDLLDAVSPDGRIIVFHNRLRHTFHPKIFLFKSHERAAVVVGSGNLTQGGLYTNYEVGVHISLDLNDKTQRGMLENIEGVLDGWADEDLGASRELTHSLLSVLVQTGLVPKEKEMATRGQAQGVTGVPAAAPDEDDIDYFGEVAVPPAPAVAGLRAPGRRFVMTLLQTDVGLGQTTAGTARRSPEIFVPLQARDAHPEFWNWPDGFEEDPARPGKFDRREVRMRVGGEIVEVNMMTWPVKHDFRLRSEALRGMGSINDILVIEKVDDDAVEYDASVIATGNPEYETMLEKCDQTVENSEKRFGYF